MKLSINETIRRLRRAADLTQEQLAERMGVSCQTVSRWETATGYPDLELLPALAALFSVSIDELLGMPDKNREEAALVCFEQLARATYAEPLDETRVIECLREVRRDHCRSRQNWRLWLGVRQSVYRRPAILKELRITVEAIAAASTNAAAFSDCVWYFAQIEDDAHIEEFLRKYATGADLRYRVLLRERYIARMEWDKAEGERLIRLFGTMCTMLDEDQIWASGAVKDTTKRMEILCFKLDLLHRFCGHTPDAAHPISGNGRLDLWIEIRLSLGFGYAACLAAAGKTEAAFAILADTVSLLETGMAIETTDEVGCDSPWLVGFTYTTGPEWIARDSLSGEEELTLYLYNRANGGCSILYPSHYLKILTEWQEFDPIRLDVRFGDYVEQVRRLYMTRKKDD